VKILKKLNHFFQQDLKISDQKEAWIHARKNPEIARIILSHASPDFDSCTEKERRFLVKFSNPWDLEKAKLEGVEIKKLVELMKKCLRNKIQNNRKNGKSPGYQEGV